MAFRHLTRARPRVAVLVVASLAFTGVARAEQGSGPSAAAAMHETAMQGFEALLREAEKSGEMPKHGSPAVDQILDTLADAEGKYGTPSFPASLPEMGVCTNVQKAMTSYVLFGLAKELKPGMSQAQTTQALLKVQARNIVAYQDEILQLMGFMTRCMATLMPELEAFVAQLPAKDMTDVRREGLRKMRLGVSQMVVGAVGQLNDSGIKPGNRGSMLDVMVKYLPPLARVLTPDMRKAVAEQVAAMKTAASGAASAKVDALLEVLRSPDCTGLCKI